MADHLGLVLPGRGYGPDGPVLRLSRLVLEQSGARVEAIRYPLDDDRLPEGEAWDLFHAAVHDQVADLIARHRPHRLTFVAKSLGTIALAGLDVDRHAIHRVEAVWLTPLFGRADVRRGALHLNAASLLVAGSADVMHEPEHHDTVRDVLAAASLVIADADHSLEVPGDVNRTLDAWAQVTAAVERFVGWHAAVD